jgi:site-specific DNA-cytosine methylase
MLQETLSLKTTLKGARVWLNNATVTNIGFVAGAAYDVVFCDDSVEIILNGGGVKNVSKGDIIDLENKKLAKKFPDTNRVHVEYCVGKIIIKAHYHEAKVKRRETSLKERVLRKIPLRFGELFAGIGLLGKTFATGLLAAGISSSLVFANENDRHATDIYYNSNVDHIKTAHPNAVVVQDDIFTMDKSMIPELDCLVIGYPCVGYSRQQSNKRKLDLDHHAAGMLFVPVLDAINRSNASIVVLENSDAMLGSDADIIMSTVMSKMGYKSSHVFLKGSDFGEFEKRKRLAKVYYSTNLPELDLSSIIGNKVNTRTLSDVLEPISSTSSEWRDLSYLQKKNDQTSHSHQFIVPSMDATRLPVFAASYGKTQADSTIIAHPEDPALHRICTASEHCNVRGLTGEFKQGVVAIATGEHHLQKGRTNKLKAHRLLGNSVSPGPWYALGEHVGKWANNLSGVSMVDTKLEQLTEQGDLFAA